MNVAAHTEPHPTASDMPIAGAELRRCSQNHACDIHDNRGASRISQDKSTEHLHNLEDATLEATMRLGNYIVDFQTETQNLLLGELFENKVPPRKPIDPSMFALELDRSAELIEHFEKNTDWGRRKAQSDKEVRTPATPNLKVRRRR
jgi:hypothetical protein